MKVKKDMNLVEVKAWLEERGTICRVDRYRLKCVTEIDHIRPGYWAAFYLPLEAKKPAVVELPERCPGQTEAWQALEESGFRPDRARPFMDWLAEQYILDREAKVERLEL